MQFFAKLEITHMFVFSIQSNKVATIFKVENETGYKDLQVQLAWCISQNTSSQNKELKTKNIAAVECICFYFTFLQQV